jgi:plastocyanin
MYHTQKVRISFPSQKMLILRSNTHLFVVPTAFSVASTQSISMQEVQAAGTAVGFAAAAVRVDAGENNRFHHKKCDSL